MKLSVLSTLALSIAVDAHCIFQKVTVNGVDQGLLTGLRAPSNNNPVQDVKSSSIACGTPGSTSATVIRAAAGDAIGAWYQHLIGGPQGPDDADNPIASSHKGPVTAYLARVDDAATASATGARWFKVFEDTLDNAGVWGVDNLIARDGWVNFELPACIPAGDYLLRVEILALHSAYAQGGAQFYASCAQLRVVEGAGTSGEEKKVPEETISLPGAYGASDPDIMINIYGATGLPDMGGKAYPAHGPEVFTC
ncbi:glycoside hydrolase family 61 protein [Xylariomycetidae sp. FL2044]|nr:glycoside hydrolase family 61 protein [Xylariomycetidae sp. FL2044]